MADKGCHSKTPASPQAWTTQAGVLHRLRGEETGSVTYLFLVPSLACLTSLHPSSKLLAVKLSLRVGFPGRTNTRICTALTVCPTPLLHPIFGRARKVTQHLGVGTLRLGNLPEAPELVDPVHIFHILLEPSFCHVSTRPKTS